MAHRTVTVRSNSGRNTPRGGLPSALEGIVDTSSLSQTNYLTHNRAFHKIGASATVAAEPAVVHFGGFEPHQVYTQTLLLKNICERATRVHIVPPETPYFRFRDFQKSGALRPGLADRIVIEFVPTEFRYYYDCVRVHTEDENLLVPLHAYPTMNDTKFPSKVRRWTECAPPLELQGWVVSCRAAIAVSPFKFC